MNPYDNEIPSSLLEEAVWELLEQHGFSDDVCNEIASLIQREESRLWAEKERQHELDLAIRHQEAASHWAVAASLCEDPQQKSYYQRLAAVQALNARQWMGIEPWDEVSDIPF